MKSTDQDALEAEFDKAVALDRAGKIEDARTIYLALADIGFSSAYFKLASMEFYLGRQEDALPWLRLLEAAAARPDAQACFECFHAYRMDWALIGGQETRDIGSDYLRRAAELGHMTAQLMLAIEHRTGANFQTKDEGLYLHWINKAIEQGSEDAVYDYAKFLADKKRPISQALLTDLEIVARDYPKAAKLLDRIKRQPKR